MGLDCYPHRYRYLDNIKCDFYRLWECGSYRGHNNKRSHNLLPIPAKCQILLRKNKLSLNLACVFSYFCMALLLHGTSMSGFMTVTSLEEALVQMIKYF